MTQYRFGIVGNGWRAGFYHRIAAAVPEQLEVVGVAVRSAEAAEKAQREHGAATFDGIPALLAARPDFVVVSVPRAAAPSVTEQIVAAGVPVLLETPPADDLDGLRDLWSRVGESGLVQVAEQYLRYPGHAARKAIIDAGDIGRATSVQVSSTHEYHAVAIMRGLLGTGFARAEVRASEFASVLIDPMGRDAWTDEDEEKDASTILATVDFDGAMGLYDFTSNQWHNQLRHRRVVVRGSRGEIVDDNVIRMSLPRTIIESPIVRRQLGYDLDLDGYATEHLTFEGRVVWRNGFPGTRFSDEELAIAEMLVATGAFARADGPDSYSLADASQDHAISLAIRAALSSGGAEAVAEEPWAR